MCRLWMHAACVLGSYARDSYVCVHRVCLGVCVYTGVLKQPAYKGLVLDFFPNGSLQQLFHNLAEGSPQPSLFQRANWALHVSYSTHTHTHTLILP